MEPSKEQNPSSRINDTFNEIRKGLEEYCKDRTKQQVWNKIFWIIDIQIGRDGLLSPQAQKCVNFYLQSKSQSAILKPIITQQKQIISKIFDLCLSACNSIDQALSTGALSQVLIKKFQKDIKQQTASTVQKRKLIRFCIQAVALHFCQHIRKSKQQNQISSNISHRNISRIISRKTQLCLTTHQFLTQILCQPVVLMIDFLDNVKPILANYLNIQSLFQITSRNFRFKKGFLSGFVTRSEGPSQFVGKVLNINTIFDSSYTGREMIQNRLENLSLTEQIKENDNQKWSLMTCIDELESKITAITSKLPVFLRPKSNGDILSFCRKQLLPTFKYQVTKSGYVQRPILTEYMQVFLNVGKNPFEVLSFPFSVDVAISLEKYQNLNVFSIIDNINVRYSKVKVNYKDIAVVPSNHYYIISSCVNKENSKLLTQIILWNTLPKIKQAIEPTLNALRQKRRMYNGYFCLPIQYIFLDYINHEYLKTSKQILELLKTYLSTRLKQEQEILLRHLKQNSSLSLQMGNICYQHRLCWNCKQFYFNYCCKLYNKKQYLCMSCSLTLEQGDKFQQIVILHLPKDLRYPLTLLCIYLSKNKHPSQKVQNLYEKNVCTGQFIGSIENQNCRGQIHSNVKALNNFFINYEKKDELFFSNRLKQLGIVTIEEMIISLALKRPKNKEQRKMMYQRAKIYCRQVTDPQSIKKIICHKYDHTNMVTQIMWLLYNQQLLS